VAAVVGTTVADERELEGPGGLLLLGGGGPGAVLGTPPLELARALPDLSSVSDAWARHR